MLTAFASVIPLVGTALVWVPITIYFLIVGSWVNALMMRGIWSYHRITVR